MDRGSSHGWRENPEQCSGGAEANRIPSANPLTRPLGLKQGSHSDHQAPGGQCLRSDFQRVVQATAGGRVCDASGVTQVHAHTGYPSRQPVQNGSCPIRVDLRDEANVRRRSTRMVGQENDIARSGPRRGMHRPAVLRNGVQ